jgi:transposase
LEEDLNKEHPYATLQERRDYIEALSGISVSRSTMCRAIARIGPTRKKGGHSSHRARGVREGGMEGDGGREDLSREIGVRG